MGVVWGSPSRSQQRRLTPAARKVAGLRRLATLGLAAPSSVGRRQVELSDHARVLAVLRGLHVDALPVPRASRFDPGRGSQAAAVATRPGSIDRVPSKAASSLGRAACSDTPSGAGTQP